MSSELKEDLHVLISIYRKENEKLRAYDRDWKGATDRIVTLLNEVVELKNKAEKMRAVVDAAMEVTRGNPNLPFNVINSCALTKMQQALKDLEQE